MEAPIESPRDASALGLGMVYQHFTSVPSLTGAENLVISREDVPAIIDWGQERRALAAFMETNAIQATARRQGGGSGGGREAEAG